MLGIIQRLKRKKGFTLVELIVVIAIIAVLTAVIVPLIGRYAVNATYSTLQDAAKTISNNLNDVLADVASGLSPVNCTYIQGKKSGGVLTVTVGGGSTEINDKVEEKTKTAFESTLAEGASFSAETRNGTVIGVIYSNDSANDVSGKIDGSNSASAVGATEVSDFANAYELSGAGAVGVAGACIPASAS